jgi:gas vesicle protein
MKGLAQKMFIPAVSAFVIMLVASCQEQGGANEKMSRVIAAENIKLKKALEQSGTEIERLKLLHNSEIKRQEGLLAKCLEEKDVWKKKSEENVKEQVGEVSALLMDENAKLRDENENLKAQIEKLKAELEKARKAVVSAKVEQ